MRLITLVALLTLSLSSHAVTKSQLDFNAPGFCALGPKAQLRQGLLYQPNQTKPYSGETVCTYALNGQWAVKGSVKNGKQNGKWTWWYENGQVKLINYYSMGKRVGTWEWWHENGQLAERATFDDNDRMTSSKSWNEDGSVHKRPEPPKLGKDGWDIQLAAFKQEEHAQNLVDKLLKAEYAARLQKANNSYRVIVGPYTKRKEAEKMQALLKQQFRLSGIVIIYKK